MSGPKKAIIKKIDQGKIEILQETLRKMGYNVAVEDNGGETIIRGKNISKDTLDMNVNHGDGKIELSVDDDTVTDTVSGADCEKTLQSLIEKLKRQDVEMEVTDWGQKRKGIEPDRGDSSTVRRAMNV